MGLEAPIGNPAVGRGWWRRFLRIRPPARKPGAAPGFESSLQTISGVPTLLGGAGKLALRCMVVGLATPAAAETNQSQGLLTSGPEPANLVIMGVALAVLFLFRRFSRMN